MEQIKGHFRFEGIGQNGREVYVFLYRQELVPKLDKTLPSLRQRIKELCNTNGPLQASEPVAIIAI